MGTGHIWYRLPQAEIAGQAIAMSLCFFRGRLEHLSLVVVNSGLYGASWDDCEPLRKNERPPRRQGSGLPVWATRLKATPGELSMRKPIAKTGDGGGGNRDRLHQVEPPCRARGARGLRRWGCAFWARR